MLNIDDALKSCAEEQIHNPESVQSFGHLLTFHSQSGNITRVSKHIDTVLQRPSDSILNTHAQSAFRSGAIHDIRNVLGYKHITHQASVAGSFVAPDKNNYQLRVHQVNEEVVVELLPMSSSNHVFKASALEGIQDAINRMESAKDIDTFMKKGTQALKWLTPFSRIMVYRFLPDGAGEVVAETLSDHLDPFLGLRYPATDIPPQARRLFQVNPLRVIASVSAPPVPLISTNLPPADLSLTVLRSVPPVHIQYLTNMDVASSLSMPIVVNNQLWGLIACHGEEPLDISPQLLATCQLVGQVFGMKLRWRLHRSGDHRIHAISGLAKRLTALNSSKLTTDVLLRSIADDLRPLIPFHGVQLCIDEQFASEGLALGAPELQNLVKDAHAFDNPVRPHTHLSTVLGEDTPPSIAGSLVISLGRSPDIDLILLRSPVVQTVRWAGKPEKKMVQTEHGVQLTPRNSFSEYITAVQDESERWTDEELSVANIIHSELSQALGANYESQQNEQRLGLIVHELNHRVRNVFALVQSLIRQTSRSVDSVEMFSHELESRVLALSTAHDLLTKDHPQGISLMALVKAELGLAAAAASQKIQVNGPDVTLVPKAAQVLILVFHELVSNAVKHGAFSSESGYVSIYWEFVEDGAVNLTWKEHGGPPVAPPTRRGCGLGILERSIPYELQGKAALKFNSEGVEATYWLPSSSFALASDVTTPGPDKPIPTPKQAKLHRVLIVEDNYLLADELASTAKEYICEHVSLAGTVAQAHRIITELSFDFCILDVNLGGELSYSVADVLMQQGVRFIFTTGYGDHHTAPKIYQKVPILTKPIDTQQLIHLACRG